ncbi:hypothetical protein [Klenkia brasiliensis]|uniref:Uncharacterized protein n=1 Tax=Klenkia brasiliensis TaxID=333142 RepID=A0A1G7QFS2_9ACTN|nr:hypothetical protein [Klenkia brasiliensis]SDF97305.1 hypothetical protein SAMN05660324_1467 [Klenkia brasiliensis]
MRLRPALAALSATALLGLAACGGSDDTAAAPSSSAAGTSSAAPSSSADATGSADAEAQAFCTEGEAALSGLQDQVETATPDQFATLLPQLVSTLDTLEPPADIAPAFQTLRDAYDQLAQAATANDLTTPEGQAAFQQAASDLGSTAQPAEDELSAWTDANCAGTASPTS